MKAVTSVQATFERSSVRGLRASGPLPVERGGDEILFAAAVQVIARVVLWLAVLFSFNFTHAATNTAALWETSARVTTGFGYRDNVLRSSIAPEGSGFFNTAADVSFLRFADSGAHLTFFLLGDDTRYFDAASVNYEQFCSATAQGAIPLNDRDELGGQFTYLYQHQVLDVSETEALRSRILVNGHSLNLRPHWKHSLGGGWAAQLEAGGLRQIYEDQLDNYWEAAGRLSLIRSYGHRSEVSLGYQPKLLCYDTREQFDSFAVAVPATTLRYWQHEVAALCRHHWDGARQWRTTTKLSWLFNRDNGSGYFNYDRMLISQQVRWTPAQWDWRANARYGWYRYQSQRVGAEHRERSYVLVDLRIERRLGKHWMVYAAAEREWNFSNDPLDKYRDWSASGGVGVEF